MRYGEMTAFEERPHSPYFGLVDATPLYVVLLDEYERWTGDRASSASSRSIPRVNWIDEYATRAPATSGIADATRNRAREPVLEGLVGLHLVPRRRAARVPAATCELQGYAYDAKLRGASRARDLEGRAARRQARTLTRPTSSGASTATSGWTTASTSRSRSTRTEAGRFAVLEQWTPALERHRRQVEGEGSAARHLLGPRLFSLGVRTSRVARVATTRSGITPEPSGRSTTSFVAWDCGATASRTRRQRSPQASSMQRRSSTAGCPRRSVAISAADEASGAVPDRCVQPAAWSTARRFAPADDARARAARRAPHRRSGAAERHRPSRAARHPRPLGRIDAFGRGRVETAEGARRALTLRLPRCPSPTRPAPSPARPGPRRFEV